jgi:hypothetical protein
MIGVCGTARHHFILVVPDDPSAFTKPPPALVDVGDGKKGFSISLTADKKRGASCLEKSRWWIRIHFSPSEDIEAAKSWFETFSGKDPWAPSPYEPTALDGGQQPLLDPINPPNGMSDTEFIRMILDKVRNFNAHLSSDFEGRLEFLPLSRNCGTFTNSVFKSCGVSESCRRNAGIRAGRCTGLCLVNTGWEDEIDPRRFDRISQEELRALYMRNYGRPTHPCD